jgi:hypothetical protein
MMMLTAQTLRILENDDERMKSTKRARIEYPKDKQNVSKAA